MARNGFVYIMYDTELYESATPIYIGKSFCSRSRIRNHFYSLKNGKMTPELYDSIKIIRLTKLPTYADAGILERYLAGKMKPTHNTYLVNEGEPTLTVDMSGVIFETLNESDFRLKRDIRTRVARIPRVSPLKHLKGCLLIECTGNSLKLHYQRSSKVLVFDDKLIGRNDIGDFIYPTQTYDEFWDEAKNIGIPHTIDYILRQYEPPCDCGIGYELVRKKDRTPEEDKIAKAFDEYIFNGKYDKNTKMMNDLLYHPEKDGKYMYKHERKELREKVLDFLEVQMKDSES